MLYVFGLLWPRNDGLIPYILRLYGKRAKVAKAAHATSVNAEENFKHTFSRAVPVHFAVSGIP
jgi:hypothetical protein